MVENKTNHIYFNKIFRKTRVTEGFSNRNLTNNNFFENFLFLD